MFWMLPLALAAAGALADKEKPLRGAAMGAGIGLTGGAAAGALGAGAAGAAGTAAGAGAAGAGAAGSGLLAAEGAGAAGSGLLGGSGLSGSLVGSGALTSSGANAAALGGSQLGGTMVGSGALAPSGAGGALLGGVTAEQAAAPVVDRGTSAGLLDKVNFQTGGNYDNLMKTGKNMNSVYGQYEQNKPQQPVAQPMPLQNKPLDLTPIINDASKMREYDMSENERRRREMQRYAQYAGGGY